MSASTLILGAGPTGLGTALGMATSNGAHPVVVVEKKKTPGGVAGSFAWNGHSVDYGPHRLSPNIDAIRVLAQELLGPDCLTKRSQHGVQFSGNLYQFPPRVADWLGPRSLWHLAAFAASFLFSKLEWVTTRFEDDTFERVIRRKFGARFLRRVAAPMARKVWIDPERIDPQFANQRFAFAAPWQVVKRILLPKQELNPTAFYYPRRGYQQLWDNMAAFVGRHGQEILFGSQAVELHVEDGRIRRARVSTPGGDRVIEGDLTVVSTIPLPALIGTLRGFPTEPLKNRLASVRFLSMLVVCFEFDQPRALPFRTLVFPEPDFCFNRLFEQNEYSRETVAPGKSVVAADITLPRGHALLQADDEQIVAKVRADLAKLKYVPLDRCAASHVERVEFAYVCPDLETRQALFDVLHELKRIANLELLGRFSVGEYDNSDYAIQNGLTLGQMLSGKLSRLEYLCAIHGMRGRFITG